MLNVAGRTAHKLALALFLAAIATTPAAQAKTAKEVEKHVAKPVKGTRASTPPAGAKPSGAMRYNKAMNWKTDPKSHSVFALGEGNLPWFIDPTSGWPYTVDAHGVIYTANPLTGQVYDLGKLATWSGDALYFFALWDFVDGVYSVPSLNTYVNIYLDNSYAVYSYDVAYTEVWEYEEYFVSEQFTQETIDIDYYEEDVGAVADQDSSGDVADRESGDNVSDAEQSSDDSTDSSENDDSDAASASDEASGDDSSGGNDDSDDSDAGDDDGGDGGDDGGDGGDDDGGE